MIGIYKITSPSGKVYIGQSVNIEKRFKQYQFLYKIKNQTKLYNSFKKYGIDAHLVEIIIECEEAELNDLERYYQDLYNVINTGLNCTLTNSSDRSGKHSKETSEKIRKSLKGRKVNPESVRKMRESLTGRKLTDEQKKSISEGRKGMKIPESTRLRMSESKKGGKNPMARKVINIETGVVFDTMVEAAESVGVTKNALYHHLKNKVKNRMPFYYA